MKLLIHSNGPTVKTGYGVQTAHLAERLKAAGHEVAVSATYGQQGAVGEWHDIRVYPTGYETNGNDIVHSHALHWFEGDELGGWIIPLLDVWCLVNPLLKEFNIAAWTPVDHYPVPPDVLKFFERTGAVPVAMSRFGERLLSAAGLNPAYVPLSVDTNIYKPTPFLTAPQGEMSCREIFKLPSDAFVVGMVAMNKGWARDRKGFNEAFRAFGQFLKAHPEAVLFVHSEWSGMAEGINLRELATHAEIPEHKIVFTDQYAYRLGQGADLMAAAYTAMDVLLAPSHGEGFCVPLIEAQACGTPVIASDFSSQTELAGDQFGAAGWLVSGQLEWDPAQHASYLCPYIVDIVDKLEKAYAADLAEMGVRAREFALRYDCDTVFADYWVPFLKTLDPVVEVLPLEREPMGDIAVIVPAMRKQNLNRLVESFDATNDGTARLHIKLDSPSEPTTSYAHKVNQGYSESSEPWVLLVGDDVEFKPGWIEAARKLSDRYDVIGTNDSSNGVKNPDVAAGRHADHFFVRRSYVEEYGACLDGPGVLAPEVYGHWYTDKEMVELAKARGVFAPCLESVVEHHHPGYDGREDLRQADPVYMKAVETTEADRQMFLSRMPLIQMQRTTLGKRR